MEMVQDKAKTRNSSQSYSLENTLNKLKQEMPEVVNYEALIKPTLVDQISCAY